MSEIKLNEQQLAAVRAPEDQPLIVIAAPGSGKTAVLTKRVAYLIGECQVDPGGLVVTTFTRRAADEMKERLEPLIGSVVRKLQIGTIHGVCLRILREEGMSKEVISTYDQTKLIRNELGYKRLNWDVGWRYPLGWIMKAKAALVQPKGSYDWFFGRISELAGNKFQAMDLSQKLSQVYRSYEEQKRYMSKMDFADMLMWAAQRLFYDDEFRARWQSRVQYVMVDEVQDTGSLSYEILKTLAAPENRMFTVGDPDQELFRWNGADPDHNIFGFKEMFPDGLVLPLEVNYRSTRVIVDASNRVIAANYDEENVERMRYRKSVRPRPDAPEGDPIKVRSYADPTEEAKGVTSDIMAMFEEGRSPADFFVVYRVNSQSRAVEDEFLKNRIPYVVQGSLGFYDRKVVRDMLAYLSLVDNENDDEAFERVANIATESFFRPTRGFGPRWMQECMAMAKARDESLWASMVRMQKRLPRWQQNAVDDLVDMIQTIRKRSDGPSSALGMIRSMCYEPYLLRSEGVDEETAQEKGLFEDLDELVYAADQFGTIREFLDHVEEMRELQAQRQKDQLEAVVLTTIHRVKGLERPVVFGVGIAENILPHKRALEGGPDQDTLPVENLSGLEDERCAAFVLVSRAKEQLFLSYPREYRNKPVDASRFLREMKLGIEHVEPAEEEEEQVKEPVQTGETEKKRSVAVV